jgi:hypothetical protein
MGSVTWEEEKNGRANLLFEAYSVYQVMNWTWQGKVFVTFLAAGLFLFVWKKVQRM